MESKNGLRRVAAGEPKPSVTKSTADRSTASASLTYAHVVKGLLVTAEIDVAELAEARSALTPETFLRRPNLVGGVVVMRSASPVMSAETSAPIGSDLDRVEIYLFAIGLVPGNDDLGWLEGDELEGPVPIAAVELLQPFDDSRRHDLGAGVGQVTGQIGERRRQAKTGVVVLGATRDGPTNARAAA